VDASFVDVYKGAQVCGCLVSLARPLLHQAAVFLVDPRRKESFKYVQRELEAVPKGIEVLPAALSS
jgi:hypothetical protein